MRVIIDVCIDEWVTPTRQILDNTLYNIHREAKENWIELFKDTFHESGMGIISEGFDWLSKLVSMNDVIDNRFLFDNKFTAKEEKEINRLLDIYIGLNQYQLYDISLKNFVKA